ncbi:hypothetical protein [Ruminococcus sp.]
MCIYCRPDYTGRYHRRAGFSDLQKKFRYLPVPRRRQVLLPYG